jgi:hypothetical protein
MRIMREFPIVAVSIMQELAQRLAEVTELAVSTDGTKPGPTQNSETLLKIRRKDVMTPHNHFHSFLDEVHREGRYRVFTDLERHAQRPPHAAWRSGGASREVVVWCSNDYLGMGRHPAVIDAMV